MIKNKKKQFLENLLSKSSNYKYKRYKNTVIRYPGGKTLGVGYILELLPDNINKVVSPFIGGGAVEIALSKELGIEVIGYDIFRPLVIFWQTILNEEKKRKMLDILYNIEPTKENFNEIKIILKKHWNYCQYKKGNKEDLIKDDIKLAAYFYFNFNLSYGPSFLGWSSKIYLDKKKYFNKLKKIENFKNNNLKVYLLDFKEVLLKHQNDFLYLDPPYYIGKDSKIFKGIYPSSVDPVFHQNFEHEELLKLLKQHKGGFILSYNNCPTIREYYKDYLQFFPKWQYTMGQGEKRIGKNRIKTNSNIKESHEILIFSPPLSTF